MAQNIRNDKQKLPLGQGVCRPTVPTGRGWGSAGLISRGLGPELGPHGSVTCLSMANGQGEGRSELCGTPGLVGAELPSPGEPSGSGHWEQTTETRVPLPRPIQGRGPCSPAWITGMQGVHLLQGRGRAGRENRELFQEGVEGRDTKIRPLVPKKTLAPSKALERGSPARNVTPGGAPRAWAVRSVRGTNSTARRPVVTGISPPPTPPAKFWSWFQLLPVCTQRTYGKPRGNKPPSPSANWLHSSFFDCPFASSAFFLLHPGGVCWGERTEGCSEVTILELGLLDRGWEYEPV